MYCETCKSGGLKNTMALGTNNFRTSTISRHLATDDHKRMVTVPDHKKATDKAMHNAQSKEEKVLWLL